MAKNRIPEPDRFTASKWLLRARAELQRRDMVDALNDVEYLAALLKQDWADMTEAGR